MADSRPNQKGRSPGAPDKPSPVRLRPTSRALQLPARRPPGSCEDREGPPVAVESDLSGDMVVRNRCPETGNEQILVRAATFAQRYEGPVGPPDRDGWLPYRPRGVQMRFVVVSEHDGSFDFIAPWGERMVARPGDSIVQDLNNRKDIYRVAKAAFACTYEVLREPQR